MTTDRRGTSTGSEGTDRLAAFSDGVIAIAITLLVIELRPPHLDAGEGDRELAGALMALWPDYLGYLISFLVIGAMWINHHLIFRMLTGIDPWLVTLNLLLLLFIGAVPFPTALVAEYLGEPGGRAAALVYGGWFTLTALVYNLVWWYPTHDRRLVRPGIDQRTLDRVTHRFRLGPPSYMLATGIALASPMLSMALHLLLALLYLMPHGGRRTGQPGAA